MKSENTSAGTSHFTHDPFSRDATERHRSHSEMRGRCPIHRLAGGELMVVSREAVEAGLKSVENFGGTFGVAAPLPEEDTILAAIPEPRHAQIRKIFTSALNQVHKVEPFVRDLARALLDDALAAAARDDDVEIMGRFGRKLPSAVIAHLLGLPATDFETFARWSDELLRNQGDGSANRPLRTLHPEFSAYLQAQIARRLDSDDPPDDVITKLSRTEIEGEPLSRHGIETQMMFFVVAGNETTRNLIGNTLLRLAQSPDLYARIRADRTAIPPLVEETLRLDSPVQLLARTCRADIDLDGVTVGEGERVFFSIASANRDERSWPDADRFDPGRFGPGGTSRRSHVAFGTGPHICPGSALARMEAKIALERLADSVRDIRLADGYRPDMNLVVWANGPQTLRVTLRTI